MSKDKQKISFVFFCGSLEMLNARFSYGKMEGMIYIGLQNMNQLNVVWRMFVAVIC